MTNEDLSHQEQVTNQSIGNVKALFFIINAFVQEKNMFADFNTFAVKTLLPGWESAKAKANEFCKSTALNFESFGSEILSTTGDENSAIITYTDFFTTDELKFFNASVADADNIHDFLKSIAQGLNLTYTWSRDGNKSTVKVTK